MATTPPLATRCNACGTAFRVVQDQLKVSEGWVRCGRCDTVFNALEQLFDMRYEPLPPNAGDGAGGERRTPESLPELPSDDAPRPPLADAFSALLRSRTGASGTGDGGRAAPAPGGAGATAAFTAWPALPSSQPFLPDFDVDGGPPADVDARAADRPAPVDLLLDVPGDDSPDHRAVAMAAPGTNADATAAAAYDPNDPAATAVNGGAAAATATAPTPEFVRAAERDARWRRAPVQRALAAASAVLLIALALQAAHHFRDGLAARSTAARPWLVGWCEQLGCSIGPPRRIGDLTVENTALAPVGGAPGTFQLSVTLRNRGAWAVALPAVDLSLTDVNGQLVARRVLAAADFRPAADRLGPDTDARLQAVLATEPRVVGYTVDLFYP